jgi:GTP-binding protein Era
MNTQTKAGFVAILGASNAGKSTLLNELLGQKISIVSRKIQTTRMRIRGILCEDATQVVFVDTPGIFKPERRLDQAMVKAAWDSTEDANHIILVIDAFKGICSDAKSILEKLQATNTKVDIVINKVDKFPKAKLFRLAESFNAYEIVEKIFMVSALTGSGVDDLRNHLLKKMPESQWYYSEEDVTDMPLRLVAAEITREHIYNLIHDELPYQMTVETEKLEHFDNGSIRIQQVLYVVREAHKQIILGKNGGQIKEIGKRSRLELEDMLGQRVHLFLFVKVKENWEEDPDYYKMWGLEYA